MQYPRHPAPSLAPRTLDARSLPGTREPGSPAPPYYLEPQTPSAFPDTHDPLCSWHPELLLPNPFLTPWTPNTQPPPCTWDPDARHLPGTRDPNPFCHLGPPRSGPLPGTRTQMPSPSLAPGTLEPLPFTRDPRHPASCLTPIDVDAPPLPWHPGPSTAGPTLAPFPGPFCHSRPQTSGPLPGNPDPHRPAPSMTPSSFPGTQDPHHPAPSLSLWTPDVWPPLLHPGPLTPGSFPGTKDTQCPSPPLHLGPPAPSWHLGPTSPGPLTGTQEHWAQILPWHPGP
ncbi:uncharacterized protein LOC133746967 [Lepus europaeus]|uniref:uncharacterized protein LOC133746967 n=1 Tax=Lepus europaeus TaxID=9983 RepID=UPI002B48F090|nr:uncharacterized protein LOC133746967 [Lepus europaeus]